MSSENSHIDSAADVSPFTRLGHILNTQQIDEHAESWGADGEEAESLLESLPEETPRLERRAEPSSPFSKRLTSGTIGGTTNGRRTAAKSSPEMSRAAMQVRLQSRMVAPAGEDTQEAPLQDLRAMAIRMGPRIEFLHEKASCRPVSTLSSLAQIRVVVQHMECVWGGEPVRRRHKCRRAIAGFASSRHFQHSISISSVSIRPHSKTVGSSLAGGQRVGMLKASPTPASRAQAMATDPACCAFIPLKKIVRSSQHFWCIRRQSD